MKEEPIELVCVKEGGENANHTQKLLPRKKSGYTEEHKSALRTASKKGREKDVRKALEDMKFDPTKDYSDVKPIHWAAESGNVPALKELLSWCKSNVAQCIGYNRNAIHMAAMKGNHEALRTLLEITDIDVNATDKQGRTALHLAAESSVEGDCTEERFLRCLKLLLERPELEVNRPDIYGRTALSRALRGQRKERVQVILQNRGDHKLNLDYTLADGAHTLREQIVSIFPEFESLLPEVLHENKNSPKLETRLLAALQQGSSHDLHNFKVILQVHGQLVQYQYKEPYHCTILELACLMKDREDFVEAMLSEDCDPNIKNYISGIPLLHMVAERMNIPVLEKFLGSACDVNIKAERMHGGNVLHWLALNKCSEDGDISALRTCVSLLLDKSTGSLDVNAVDERKDTPLHIAVRWNMDLVFELLSSDASVDKFNKNEHTPLHVAALCGNKDAVLTLLKYGADINAANTSVTPLYVAAQQRKNDIVLLLLNQGANFMYETQGEPTLQYIEPDILETFFDNCIESNNKNPKDSKYMLVFKFHFIPVVVESADISQSSTEMHPLLKMSEMPELRRMLKHPLISSVLFLKWRQACKIFYFNIGLYSIFLLLLTHHMIFINDLMAWNKVLAERVTVGAETSNLTAALHGSHGDARCISVNFPLWISLALIILRETIQFAFDRREYLHNPGNILDTSIIVSTLVYCCAWDTSVIHHSASIAILLAWIECLLLVGRLPSVSVQLEMLKQVSWTFLKFGLCYLPLFFAFAFSFSILFRGKHEESESIYVASDFLNMTSNSLLFMFETFIMFTGEFEAKDLPFSETPVTSHLVYFLFVFLIALALLNLLNGLAVSDTQAIKDDAKTLSLVARAKLVLQTEAMILRYQRHPCLRKYVRKFCFFFRDLPHKRLYLYPNDLKLRSEPGKEVICEMDPAIAKRARAVVIRNKSIS